jgi:predicted PurR-regulated permease PerM
VTTKATTPGVSGKSANSWALTIIAVGVVIGILYWARVVFITAAAATIIALILEPFVEFLGRVRVPRSLGAFIVCLLAGVLLYLVALASYNQVASIAGNGPEFEKRVNTLVDSVANRLNAVEGAMGRLFSRGRKPETPPAPKPPAPRGRGRQTTATPPPDPNAIQEVRIHEDRNPVEDYLVASLSTVYEFLLMISFVPFLVYFMLSWRDHMYRSFLRFFEGQEKLIAARSLQGISAMVRAFVVGNFATAVLASAASLSLFAAVHLPYPLLSGIASGFLTIMPYVGLPAAMLPVVLAALLANAPGSVLLISILIVVAMHLVAMNVFYPLLVGARVHLNPLAVTFSFMFWGFLWDAAGLLLAIPIMAGLKAVCDNVEGLKAYGRFLGD